MQVARFRHHPIYCAHRCADESRDVNRAIQIAGSLAQTLVDLVDCIVRLAVSDPVPLSVCAGNRLGRQKALITLSMWEMLENFLPEEGQKRLTGARSPALWSVPKIARFGQ